MLGMLRLRRGIFRKTGGCVVRRTPPEGELYAPDLRITGDITRLKAGPSTPGTTINQRTDVNDDPNRVHAPRYTAMLTFQDESGCYLATVEATGSIKVVVDIVNWAATSFREEQEGE
jgi:hypothetical protein